MNKEESDVGKKKPEAPASTERRRFLGQVGGAAAAGAALNLLGASSLSVLSAADAQAACEVGPELGEARANLAAQIRNEATAFQRGQPLPAHPCNNDEDLYPTRIGNYTKALLHDSLGIVVPSAYNALLAAITSANPAQFEAIPLPGDVKLVDPQAGFAFDLEGADSRALTMPPAPAYASFETASEMVELYWQALTRDVPFAEYETNADIQQAAAELTSIPPEFFRGPRINGQVTPQTIFRGVFPGDLVGPYVSQFLTLNVPYGAELFEQRIRTAVPGLNYMTDYTSFLNVQNGGSFGQNQFDPVRRFIRNGRDIGEYVHRDFPAQAFINAALISIILGVPPNQPFAFGTSIPGVRLPFDSGNPYGNSRTQEGFPTFGSADILSLVADVPVHALRHAWYQKWAVHRRVRPEEYGGHVRNRRRGTPREVFPFPDELLATVAVAQTEQRTGEALLPQAFPEGSPTHTSYPSGHAVYSGACVTVLKAYFDESFVIPEARQRVASADGTQLLPLTGVTLTVGGELNKLASNISIARDAAGVHWRSDAVEGLRLGEQVGIRYLQDVVRTYNQRVRGTFAGFTLTKFDGTQITIV